MFLDERYYKGLGCWVKEETKERVTQAVVLYNWEENWVLEKETLPKCYSSNKCCSQTWTLSSCNVLKGARYICTTRNFTETT